LSPVKVEEVAEIKKS
jgi:hypothetical protein